LNDKTSDKVAWVPLSAKAEARGAQGIYPMRVAVQLTGLTPDTIRAWERRYHAIEPVRSAGNTRKFTHDDIRRLLLLREATEAGHSIGNIAELADAELRALRLVSAGPDAAAAPARVRPQEPIAPRPAAIHATDEAPTAPAPLDDYFQLLAAFDVVRAGAWLRRVAALMSPRTFVLDVVVPLLAGIRERRADASLGGAHVIAAWQQISATLSVLVEVTAAPREAAELLAIGAPRQRHAIHALATILLARHHGREAVFLGAAVPDADLQWAVDALAAPTVVIDLSVPLNLESMPSAYTTLERLATRHRVWLLWPPGVAVAEGLRKVEIVTDLASLDALLALPSPRNGGAP